MWFNYGNVNGFDFWNNSDAIKPENRSKMGSIYQEKILSARSGPDRGDLTVESEWITGTDEKILDETTRYVFTKRDDARVIDQITTLKALDHVVFNDDKEGLLGKCRFSGRQRDLSDERRKDGRPSLGNTGALVYPDWLHRQQDHYHCNPGPPWEPWVPDVLACARVRIVRCESPRPEDL
jgi:hypothetical protein